MSEHCPDRKHEYSQKPGYAPEKIEYGVKRYVNETRRLYRTLDTHLASSTSGFIVGDRVTIADISIWGWVSSASMSRPPFLTI